MRCKHISMRGCDARHGFTLFELMVVIAIMLALMGAAIPVLSSLLEVKRVDSGAQTIQAMLVGAREYAVEHRKYCAIRFKKPTGDTMKGMRLELCYADTAAAFSSGTATLVPDRSAEVLPDRTLVARGVPNLGADHEANLAAAWALYTSTPSQFYIYFTSRGQLDRGSEFRVTVIVRAASAATEYFPYIINRNTGTSLKFD
ncbi:MAG: prepilin-type N-terminal cleavage/methylation domain-containing protein [Planctomycetia bacterium]|nr:prepilin-type N-terminal cleavage/methylation domain-containing protein [Planctomycetia bacterium]